MVVGSKMAHNGEKRGREKREWGARQSQAVRTDAQTIAMCSQKPGKDMGIKRKREANHVPDTRMISGSDV